jgi:hypothetical protein
LLKDENSQLFVWLHKFQALFAFTDQHCIVLFCYFKFLLNSHYISDSLQSSLHIIVFTYQAIYLYHRYSSTCFIYKETEAREDKKSISHHTVIEKWRQNSNSELFCFRVCNFFTKLWGILLPPSAAESEWNEMRNPKSKGNGK